MKKTLILAVIIFCNILSTYSQDTLKLNEFIFTKLKIEKSYPITQSVVSCDSVQFLNLQKDPFFVFNKISPSIYSQSDNGEGNGYSYIRMRGLDQTRINFNLNGIPLNEMEDQGIYFSNIPGFYNYISDISIQRGITTSKYGNASIAGSMNMETYDIFEKGFKFSTSVMGNTESDYINFLYSPGDQNKKTSWQLGSSLIDNAGFKEHSNNTGGSVFYGIGYHNNKNILKLIGFTGISKNQLSFYGVPMDIIKSKYNTNLNPVTDVDLFNQNFININWVNYNRWSVNNNLYFNNVNGGYNTSGIDFGVNSYQLGISSNFNIEDNKSTKSIGLNTNFYQRKHFGYDNNGFYDYPKNSKLYVNWGYKNDITGYFKLIQKLNKINILYDIQIRNVTFKTYDKTSTYLDYNWIFINPKIGIKKINKSSDIYLTIGYINREPTRSDIMQNIIQSNNLQYANPDNIIISHGFNDKLKPENVINAELGVNWYHKIFNIKTNLYLITIHNEFVSTGDIDQFSGFMWKIPVNQTWRYGIESEGKIKINAFNIFYNFQFQKNKLGDKNITFNPEIIALLGSSVKFSIFETGIYFQYISKMAINYNINDLQLFSKNWNVLSGYLKINTGNKIYVTLNIDNILNDKYYIPAGVFGGEPIYYVGELLNYKISVTYRLWNY